MKRKIFFVLFLFSFLILSGCSHSAIGNLVGNDRDEHGCKGSAGYTWSYALHDCVRLWEVGRQFDSGPDKLCLIFSADSTFAEIFTQDEESIICKRVKGSDKWIRRKGNEQVSIKNGIICVEVDNYSYTQTQ